MNTSLLDPTGTRRRFLRRILTGIGAGLALTPTLRAASLRAGDTFPALANFGLGGPVPDLVGKVVLVDFWASWCSPCRKSFPVMKEIGEKFGSRGFIIVAVCLDEDKAAMEGFLKKNSLSGTVLHDPKGRLAERVGVEKMPTSFLVGADGKVAAVHSGFDGEGTRRQYLTEVEMALKAAGK